METLSGNRIKQAEWKRTRAILARSFYNEMKSHGYSPHQIIELSSEILGLVTSEYHAYDHVEPNLPKPVATEVEKIREKTSPIENGDENEQK
jgi:hypothetical protein